MGFQIHPLRPQVRDMLLWYGVSAMAAGLLMVLGSTAYMEFTVVRLTEQELAEGAARCKDQGLVAYNAGGYPKHKIACTLPRR